MYYCSIISRSDESIKIESEWQIPFFVQLMTKNWVCHSWKNRSWIDCHKFGSTLELYKCKEERIWFWSKKFCSHIIYIYCHYIKLLRINVSTFHWADCLIWCSRERCQKHPKSTQNLWIFYATYNVWRENTQVLASPSFKRHVMSKRSFLYHLVLKYSFRWQLEYDLSLFLWMLSNSFARFQTLAILDISKQIYQFCNIILGASIISRDHFY